MSLHASSVPLDSAPFAPPAPPSPDAPATALATALVRALEQRGRPGADVDAALALYVRRARAEDEPVERMLARLKGLLLAHARPLRAGDDAHELVALVMRRAITEYYRA